MGKKVRSLFIIALATIVLPFVAKAQALTVAMNQDVFFGFYPSVSGATPLSKDLDFSFYGTFWTTPNFGTGSNGGGSLWTEIGVGANFKMMDGKLGINPQIGITNGVLQTGANRGVLADGLIPSLTVNLNSESIEGQIYAGYYLGLRERSPSVNNFLHYWILAGYKFSNSISAGIHFEQLNASNVPVTGESRSGNYYTWYGPYIQFTSKGGYALRFSGGMATYGSEDVKEATLVGAYEKGDFYKMSAIIPLGM
jgi:hypothetical protein